MTRARRAGVAAAVLAVVAVAVLGLLRAVHPAAPPSLDQRVAAVAATLKCPTCAGLSVQDSTSVLASGSRQVIRQQLAEGRTPDQVRQWFVDRYGEQVLLAPDPGGPGLLAWLLPALAVPLAGVLVWRWTRRPRGGADDAADATEAATALGAWREGRLDPRDGSPAGDALHAALLARVAAEEDAGSGGGSDGGEGGARDEVVVRADRRLAAAHRRWAARPATAPPRPADTRSRPAAAAVPARARTVARRPVAVGALALLAVAGGSAVAVTVHARSAGTPAVGASPAAATAAEPAGPAAAMPSPPAGWTGGMPTTAAQWVALGRAYDKAAQLPQAAAAYGMALRLQPGADDVLLLRDDVLVRSGQAAAALPDLQQLDQRHPGTPDVLLILGLAENRTGSPAATTTLQRFLQLAPDSPAAPGVRQLLGQG